jgi:hypothetical protein
VFEVASASPVEIESASVDVTGPAIASSASVVVDSYNLLVPESAAVSVASDSATSDSSASDSATSDSSA